MYELYELYELCELYERWSYSHHNSMLNCTKIVGPAPIVRVPPQKWEFHSKSEGPTQRVKVPLRKRGPLDNKEWIVQVGGFVGSFATNVLIIWIKGTPRFFVDEYYELRAQNTTIYHPSFSEV